MKKRNILISIKNIPQEQYEFSKLVALTALGQARTAVEGFGLYAKVYKQDTEFSLVWYNDKLCNIKTKAMSRNILGTIDKQCKDRRLYHTLAGNIFTENAKGELMEINTIEK